MDKMQDTLEIIEGFFFLMSIESLIVPDLLVENPKISQSFFEVPYRDSSWTIYFLIDAYYKPC